MVGTRAQFASTLQVALVVLQAIVAVGLVGIAAVDPDPGNVLPFLGLNGYLLVLSGAALIYFRREHAALWRGQLSQRTARFCERAWPASDEPAPRGGPLRLIGARTSPQAVGLRGTIVLAVGMLISLTALAIDLLPLLR